MSWASVCLVLSVSLFCFVELIQIPTANAALAPDEEDALEILRDSFKLSNWTGDPCTTASWITCFDNSVSALNLGQRNLTGTIPVEIGRLRRVNSLILSGNSLTGPLPDLSNMTNLTNLALDGNNLTGGILPSNFNHSELKTLNLSNNPLGGSIPDGSGLSKLITLDLTRSQMSGSIPGSIKSLRLLETLQLGSNPQLTGSIAVVSDLLTLKTFNASYCAFSDRLPDMGAAAGLESLDLQMNDFNGSIPLNLFHLVSLRWLYLNNNPRLSGPFPDTNLWTNIETFVANDCNLSGPLSAGFFSNNLKLQYIGLWNNRLTSFPTDMQNLTELQIVDVHNNTIRGVLPDLPPSSTQTKLESLKWLTFSSNQFYGTIPRSWNELTYLERMLLDFNNLSGHIPKEFDKLTNLRQLNLSSNSFSGDIPQELGNLPNLEILDLSNNQFSGTVPGTLALLKNLHTLLLDNNGFTGIPISLVNRTDITISYKNNPDITILVDDLEGKKRSGTSTGTIVGVVIGLCAIIGIALLAATLYWKRRQRKYTDQQISKEDMPKSAQSFTLRQIKVITENHKTFIGKGGFGPVYYGKLLDGKEVAVKVRATDSKQGAEEFLNEVRLLSRLHHRYLVSLVGYCLESQQHILVYDFMAQGTLYDHLYRKGRGSSSSKSESKHPSTSQPLRWKTRLNIAINAAKGLEYLHKDCNPPVIHRDVKSSNILLTDKLQAKVADLGISKAAELDAGKGFNKSGVSTIVKGTFGYMDPEYFIRRRLTTKSDVYSFGMVLLEIITAKKPQTENFPDSRATNLVDWVRDAVTSNRLESIVDPALQDGYDREVMLRVARVALSCVLLSGQERPEMGDVARTLTEALQMEEYMDTSSNSIQEICPLPIEQELPLSLETASASSSTVYTHPSWITDPR